jgi:hypothetical protein
VVAQQAPYAVEEVRDDALQVGRHLLVDLAHPLTKKLCRLPPELGAPLLLRAALVGAGRTDAPVDAALLEALQ